MTAITIEDLNNAKEDVDHIAEVANSTADTAVDRLGHTKPTVAGAMKTLTAINFRGAWATATAYAVKDAFSYGGIVYATVLAHTSTTVAADLAAGKIGLYQGVMTQTTDDFFDGTDYTAGSSTSITLSRAPGSQENLQIFFGTDYQGPNQWSLSGSTVTFTAPIPVGVTEIFAHIGVAIAGITPSSRSVGDSELAWGRTLGRVASTIAELKALSGGVYKRAFVMGYYADGDGGGGPYYRDDSDTTSADNGGSVVVASDGGRWKLIFGAALSGGQFGVKANNTTDDTLAIQNAIIAMYNAGGGDVILPDGSIKVTSTILLYPNVYLRGQGKGRTYLQWQGAAGTTVMRTTQLTPGILSIGGGVVDLSINGQNAANGITGVDLSDAQGWEVRRVEFANLIYGLHFNKYATASGSPFGGQAYFNRAEQCEFVQCTSCVAFGGAANRNTFNTNTLRSSNVAYDFGITGNVSETNVFINENVEGCHSWAEWSGVLANIYSQTWIGLTVENPTSNGYVCTMKDPGRQNLIGLTIIPANNLAAVDFYNVFNDGAGKAIRSDVFGTRGSSGGYSGYGNRSVEDFHLLGGALRTRMFGTASINQTITSSNYITVSVTVPGALIGDTVAWSLDQSYPTLQKDVVLTANGIATLTLFNQTGSSIAVNCNVYVSVAGRSTTL